MTSFFVISLILVVVTSVKCQVLLDDACPFVPVQKHFSTEKFLGTWYEIERFYSDTQVNNKCTKVEFARHYDGRVNLISASIHERTGRPLVSHGVVTSDYSDLSRMTVQLAPRSNSPSSVVYPYWVLDTDYITYAVVFSCEDICRGSKHTESLWLLGRTAVIPDEALRRIYRKLVGYGIDPKRLMKVEQKQCVNVAVRVRSQNSYFNFNRNAARNFLVSLTNHLNDRS